MNRYRSGGPSKATSTTLCQKCLKRGHYSYECKASQQDRPYNSRPSRTQQLLNPQLAPKIKEDSPKPSEARSKAATLPDSAIVTPREEMDAARSLRSRSVSSYSSDSVSTISTNRSRSVSRSPPRRRRSHSAERLEGTSVFEQDPKSRQRQRIFIEPKDRMAHEEKTYRQRESDKHPQRRRSRSGARDQQRLEKDSRFDRRSRSPESRTSYANTGLPKVSMADTRDNRGNRERSLSPYSARLALSQGR